MEDKLPFSKIKHGQNEEIFETIVTDGTGRELEKRIERNYEYYCNHLLREHKKIEGKK